jgi:hypothetical protein
MGRRGGPVQPGPHEKLNDRNAMNTAATLLPTDPATELIAVKLHGPWTVDLRKDLLKRWDDAAQRQGRVRFLAEAQDQQAWEGLEKFFFLVRWLHLGQPVDQRMALLTGWPLIDQAAGLLAVNTPNMQVRPFLLNQQKHAITWLEQTGA